MFRNFGLLQEIPKHRSYFSLKKSLAMGLFFKIFQGSLSNILKNWCVLWRNPSKWVLIFGKFPRNGYPEKLPLDIAMGFEPPAAQPQPIQIWIPPPVELTLIQFWASTFFNHPQSWYLVEKWIKMINQKSTSQPQFNQQSTKFEVEIST